MSSEIQSSVLAMNNLIFLHLINSLLGGQCHENGGRMLQFMIGNRVSRHIVHYLSRHSLQQLSNFKTFLSSVDLFKI